jgi:CTP:molybdopterin cytidylyltransferase MocA
VTTVGLLLAAGAGRRMGGPKALLRLAPDGPTLAEAAVRRLREAGCERVVVVVGSSAEQAADAVAHLRVDVVTAPDWVDGMGASLRAGLAHLDPTHLDPTHRDPTHLVRSPDQIALVTLVDLPDVTSEVMARVLAAARPEGAAALVRAAYDDVPGHPVAIGRDHWDAVRATARGDRGARDHLRVTPHLLVECGDLATGCDVDTTTDVEGWATSRRSSDDTQQ